VGCTARTSRMLLLRRLGACWCAPPGGRDRRSARVASASWFTSGRGKKTRYSTGCNLRNRTTSLQGDWGGGRRAMLWLRAAAGGDVAGRGRASLLRRQRSECASQRLVIAPRWFTTRREARQLLTPLEDMGDGTACVLHEPYMSRASTAVRCRCSCIHCTACRDNRHRGVKRAEEEGLDVGEVLRKYI